MITKTDPGNRWTEFYESDHHDALGIRVNHATINGRSSIYFLQRAPIEKYPGTPRRAEMIGEMVAAAFDLANNKDFAAGFRREPEPVTRIL